MFSILLKLYQTEELPLVLEYMENKANRFDTFRDPGTYIHMVSKTEISQMFAKLHIVPLQNLFRFFILFSMIQIACGRILVQFHEVFTENEQFSQKQDFKKPIVGVRP